MLTAVQYPRRTYRSCGQSARDPRLYQAAYCFLRQVTTVLSASSLWHITEAYAFSVEALLNASVWAISQRDVLIAPYIRHILYIIHDILYKTYIYMTYMSYAQGCLWRYVHLKKPYYHVEIVVNKIYCLSAARVVSYVYAYVRTYIRIIYWTVSSLFTTCPCPFVKDDDNHNSSRSLHQCISPTAMSIPLRIFHLWILLLYMVKSADPSESQLVSQPNNALGTPLSSTRHLRAFGRTVSAYNVYTQTSFWPTYFCPHPYQRFRFQN